jgi:hypothetical protein
MTNPAVPQTPPNTWDEIDTPIHNACNQLWREAYVLQYLWTNPADTALLTQDFAIQANTTVAHVAKQKQKTPKRMNRLPDRLAYDLALYANENLIPTLRHFCKQQLEKTIAASNDAALLQPLLRTVSDQLDVRLFASLALRNMDIRYRPAKQFKTKSE